MLASLASSRIGVLGTPAFVQLGRKGDLVLLSSHIRTCSLCVVVSWSELLTVLTVAVPTLFCPLNWSSTGVNCWRSLLSLARHLLQQREKPGTRLFQVRVVDSPDRFLGRRPPRQKWGCGCLLLRHHVESHECVVDSSVSPCVLLMSHPQPSHRGGAPVYSGCLTGTHGWEVTPRMIRQLVQSCRETE